MSQLKTTNHNGIVRKLNNVKGNRKRIKLNLKILNPQHSGKDMNRVVSRGQQQGCFECFHIHNYESFASIGAIGLHNNSLQETLYFLFFPYYSFRGEKEQDSI